MGHHRRKIITGTSWELYRKVNGRLVFVDNYNSEARAVRAADSMGFTLEDFFLKNPVLEDMQKCRAILNAGTVQVTLDDEPAVILGFSKSLATVHPVGGSQEYRWAWAAVLMVLVQDGGRFRSDDGRIF